MLSFIKKIFVGNSTSLEDVKKEIQEETVLGENELEALGLKQENIQDEMEEDAVHTRLSLHEEWDQELENEQKYVLSFLQLSLPAIKEGQVAITGFNIIPHEDGMAVSIFIRNGLSRPIRFEHIPLLFVAEDGTVIARQEFNLEEIGEIPPHADRPWTIVFSDEHILARNTPFNKWKIAFEIKRQLENIKLDLDIDPTWKTHVQEQQQVLEDLLASLPPIRTGEFNISGLEAARKENGSIEILVLLRNGNDRMIKLHQIPLVLEDAEGNQTASGLFEVDNLEIRAYSAKPWRFIFPPELVRFANPNLSHWTIRPVNN